VALSPTHSHNCTVPPSSARDTFLLEVCVARQLQAFEQQLLPHEIGSFELENRNI
jgi:hypothetical protein